jgi:two-component system, OmpR family, sensor kinase
VRTPSLRRRVILSGVAVVTLLLVVFGAFLYLTLQARLEDSLEDVLDARAELARELAAVHDLDELAERLQAIGIPATVTGPGGDERTAEPASPRFGEGPPDPASPGTHQVSRVVGIGDGATVEVFASRAGVDTTLRRLLVLVVAGIAAAILSSVLLFRRAATYAVGPLDEVVVAAGRTAAGHTGERLQADDPDTELGRLAVAYDRMLDSLEDALTETQAAEERTRRFVDDAAHQLRTPLATIRGSVEALLRESDPRVRDRLMSNLVREAARSNRLLTSLLTMARLDQGRPPEVRPTDLADICHDEVARARSLAPSLTIACDLPGEPGQRWLLDDQWTREILANLLDNARRHARSRIEVTSQLWNDEESPVLEVTVRDDGPGIPDGADELIFERFATLDGQGGSGLGLPIARSLARGQGGDLLYHDRRFVLRLPAVEPRDREVEGDGRRGGGDGRPGRGQHGGPGGDQDGGPSGGQDGVQRGGPGGGQGGGQHGGPGRGRSAPA